MKYVDVSCCFSPCGQVRNKCPNGERAPMCPFEGRGFSFSFKVQTDVRFNVSATRILWTLASRHRKVWTNEASPALLNAGNCLKLIASTIPPRKHVSPLSMLSSFPFPPRYFSVRMWKFGHWITRLPAQPRSCCDPTQDVVWTNNLHFGCTQFPYSNAKHILSKIQPRNAIHTSRTGISAACETLIMGMSECLGSQQVILPADLVPLNPQCRKCDCPIWHLHPPHS